MDISYGSLTYPPKHRHGDNLFIVIPSNNSFLVVFYDKHGDTDDLFSS